MSYIIQTHGLTKAIGGKELVRGVELHVKQGEVYGFLGPNGAGKTTVMKMLTNLWKPTAGTIELFGQVLTPTSYGLLERMGSIIEFPTFYDHLSGEENLRLHCAYMGYHGQGGVERALDMLDLGKAAGTPVKQYSLGMRQRLGIARAVLTKPELLILDEPTNGLDPAGMKQIRDLMRLLCREYGITVMVSTHILSEVEPIADTIGVIHHGTLRSELSLREIEAMGAACVELTVTNTERAAFVLADRLELSNFKIVDLGTVRVYDTRVSPQELSKTLTMNGVELVGIAQRSETLEDYFLKLTSEVAE